MVQAVDRIEEIQVKVDKSDPEFVRLIFTDLRF